MTETEQADLNAYTLVVAGDNVSIYRLPCPPDEPGVLESTVTPSGLAWIARTPHGDFLAENLRGGVAEALDLFRDRDRGPGDPAEVEWQWEQMVRATEPPPSCLRSQCRPTRGSIVDHLALTSNRMAPATWPSSDHRRMDA